MSIAVVPPRPKVPTKESYLDSAQVVRDIRAGDGFEQDREQHGLAIALGRTAGRLAELEVQNTEAKDQQLLHAYTVISKLPNFVTGNDTLKGHRQTKNLPREVVREAKIGLVEFNHSIKKLFDYDPTLHLSEVAHFLTDIHQLSIEQTLVEETDIPTANDFRHEVEARLRGMQHEIFARNIIDSLAPEFTVDDDISVEDDLKGADLFVTYQGVKFPIDIKSSPFRMRESQKHSQNPEHIIWSGINTKDAGDRFRLTTVEIESTKEYMRSALLKAHAEYLVRARRLGTRVLQQKRLSPSPAKPVEEVKTNEANAGPLQPMLTAHFNEIRDYQVVTATAEQQKQMLELLYTELYPAFSRYFDQLGSETVLETREKICHEFASKEKSRHASVPDLRRLIEKMIREYQIHDYAKKYPKRISLARNPGRDEHDIVVKGKKLLIQNGLHSVVDQHAVTSGYCLSNDKSIDRKKVRIHTV